MATSPLFGWQEPDDTSLVKDGAAAIRTLGNAIDTSMGDLLGGTSGQILSKASNTDMDFTWITNDVGDITAVTAGTGISGGGTSGAVTVTNSMATTMTTKGDLVPATGSGTFARLAAGSNGETIVADSSTSTGLRYQGNYAAGKNKIINGDFSIWQRGTSFTMAGSGIYTADRWNIGYIGATGATVSQYVMTPQELNDFRFGCSIPGTLTDAVNGYILFRQPIENVTTYSNQTITVSFYAKGSTSGTIGVRLVQDFGTGGSPSSAVTITPQTQAITTSWTRYNLTFVVPSISGKTIGTNNDSKFYVNFDKNIGTGNSLGYGTNPNYTGTLSVTGIQSEIGSVATAFQTATGTIQGETSACQRYYYRQGGLNTYQTFGGGFADQTTTAIIQVPLPATMRVAPTSVDFSTLNLSTGGTNTAVTSLTILSNNSGNGIAVVYPVVASGLTANRPYSLTANNSTNGYLGLSAEL